MHKVELIDCQKFIKEFNKREHYPIFADLEVAEFKAIMKWLEECVVKK